MKPISSAKEDIICIVESRILKPEQIISYDKNGTVRKIFESNWINLKDPNRLKNLFKEEIYKFMYYFNCFLSNLAKDDEYRAYMNYTIAFYKLVNLKAMIEGEFYNLYQPKKFTTDIIKDWSLRNRFYKATAGLRKYGMFDQKDNLSSLFLEIMEKGLALFKIELDPEQIYTYFKKSKEKYPAFKNFRDISLIPNIFSNHIKIKEGLIYRSASLLKNSNETILKFLREKNIRYILDLRGEKELQDYLKYDNFYNDEIKKKYVVNIPIEPKVDVYIPDKLTENFYYGFLKEYKNEIKIIFEKYFANALQNKLIIHCEGGKDRTGIIIAILLDILHIEREIIIGDYLLSYNNTKRDNIEFLMDKLNIEYRGSENFLLEHCNASSEVIQKLKKNLVKNF